MAREEQGKNYINTTFSGNRQQNTILSEWQIKEISVKTKQLVLGIKKLSDFKRRLKKPQSVYG